MPSTSMHGEIPEGIIPLCLVIGAIVIGAAIANTGATNGNPMQMAVGLIIALGALVLGLGGYIKFKF